MTVRENQSPGTGWPSRMVRPVGILAIIAGLLMIVTGGVVWGTVSSQLQAQRITVGDDARMFAGSTVADPFTALAEADVINMHTEKMSGGKTYAEIDREDPMRETVMNASFLRASLFTSVVSFGVSAFAIGAGAIIALLGWAVWTLGPRAERPAAGS